MHPLLLSSRCRPWVFIGAGQPLQSCEVRDTNLAWVRPVLIPGICSSIRPTAVYKPKFMGRLPHHLRWKTGLHKLFLLIFTRNLFFSYHGWGTTQQCEWILEELGNRFCMIFATDSWQRTSGHDECVHTMTNIIHNYRFVKPYIIYNIA